MKPAFRHTLSKLLALGAVGIGLAGCADVETSRPSAAPVSRTEDFNRNWRFTRGEQPGAASVDFDDSGWQAVRLPHDWAIAGPYDPEGNPHTGKLPWRGEGWYRKTFFLASSSKRA